MNHAINLISDTVTKPCTQMKRAMMEAEVGDDVFGTDPTVNALEKSAAQMFGKEAGLYCPSGTMTNQLAIKVHTQPMDEVICEEDSHIFHYENAAYALHSGVGLYTLKGEYGKLNTDLINSAIRPRTDWYPRSSLVVIENSCNKAGGTHYSYEEMKGISDFCRQKDLAVHLDGARIFNVLVEENFDLVEVGNLFDTLSICLSKGLGAPVGSLLLGSKDQIQRARRLRKAFGGGMRQAGIIAAAGLYALENNVQRLKEDHQKAVQLKEMLQNMPEVDDIRPGNTNIVIFDLKKGLSADGFIEKLKKEGILCAAFGPRTIRLVTHKDVSFDEINYCVEIMGKLKF